jgi:hypothetical protein
MQQARQGGKCGHEHHNQHNHDDVAGRHQGAVFVGQREDADGESLYPESSTTQTKSTI